MNNLQTQLFKTLFVFVFITATVMPSLQQLSQCLVKKESQLKRSMQVCHKDNHDCMVKVVLKVCTLKM